MNSTRRNFLKRSLAASATAALATGISARAAQPGPSAVARDYYELRAYRLKPETSSAVLENYLEKALIPGLNARGLTNIGVFTEVEVDKKAVTAKPKIGTPTAPVAIWMLIPVAAKCSESVGAQHSLVAIFIHCFVGTFPQERKLIFV